MATVKISLDYDTDVFEITSDNKLSVKISAADGNTLHSVVTSGDTKQYYGLFAHAPKGANGASGNGYPPGDGQVGVRVGYANPYESKQSTNATVKKRICGSLTVHRTWISDGKDSEGYYKLINFRDDLDYVMPGDIVQIGSDYYVVETVTSDTGTEPGNRILSVKKI